MNKTSEALYLFMKYTDELNCGESHDPLSEIDTNHKGEKDVDKKKRAS